MTVKFSVLFVLGKVQFIKLQYSLDKNIFTERKKEPFSTFFNASWHFCFILDIKIK